jgi:hypothetical protein
LRVDEKRTAIEINARIGPVEMEAGRHLTMFEGQHGFDQTGNPRGGLRMTNVRLHRADGTEGGPPGAAAKHLPQGGDLDWISQCSGRTVRFDEGHCGGIKFRER